MNFLEILKIFIKLIIQAFFKEKIPAIDPPAVDTLLPEETKEETKIDWSNPEAKISKYFTVKEAILLRNWDRLADETDGLNEKIKNELIRIFRETMDPIRELLGRPVFIKSAYRPKKYNVSIGGATRSAHMADRGYAAVDFWTDADGDGELTGQDCDAIKEILMPLLEKMNIRMEDNGKGARWVHVDNKPVAPGGNRFFLP